MSQRAWSVATVPRRLVSVRPSSLNRELDVLRLAFEIAPKSWDIPLTQNVFALVTRPKGALPTERRLRPGERGRLKRACLDCRNKYIRYLVELALETAMRRDELLAARWAVVSFEARALHIPMAKNGYSRTIPLSSSAVALLGELLQFSETTKALPANH